MELTPLATKKFWEVRNLSDSDGELILYGEIAGDRPWWDSEKQMTMIVPIELMSDLQVLRSKEKITVHLNSPGGDIFAAHAIFTQLKSMSAWIDMVVDALSASAAIILLMAANRVLAPSNALFLIHKPMVKPNGYVNEDDLQELDKALKTIKASIFEAYAQRLKMPEAEIDSLMAAAEWKTAREAKELGLVDEILFETVEFAASADKNLLFANSVPLDISNLPTRPEVPVKKPTQEELPMATNANPGSTIPTNAAPAAQAAPTNAAPPLCFENVAQLEEHSPTLVAQIRNEAIAGERRRIEEIEKISPHIPTELVNEAKFTNPIDAKELSFKAMQANAVLAGAYAQNAQADAAESMAAEVGGVPGAEIATPPSAKKGLQGTFANIVSGLDRSTRSEA